jgi:hypothetical protein
MFALALLTSLFAADDKDFKIDAKELAALKKKVGGKVVLEPKTGVVQIAYDFSTARQRNDFLIKDKPAAAKGGFVLKPNASVEHVVPWKTVQVEAQVQVTKMLGGLMKASQSKAEMSMGGDNQDGLYLSFPGQASRFQYIVPARDRVGLRTVRFELLEDRSTVAYESYQVSEPTKLGDAGKIEFFGGNYGHAFRTIVFRGRPDPVWLKEIVEKK